MGYNKPGGNANPTGKQPGEDEPGGKCSKCGAPFASVRAAKLHEDKNKCDQFKTVGRR